MVSTLLLIHLQRNTTKQIHHSITIVIVLGQRKEPPYSLMGYGISMHSLPFDESMQTVKTKNQVAFLRVRKKIEAEFYGDSSDNNNHGRDEHHNIVSDNSSDESSYSDANSYSSDMIECPSINDVIFRVGFSGMDHPGNMMFRELIEKHSCEHNVAKQERKTELTSRSIDESSRTTRIN
mmetsp:Transcript_8994/g.19412  ORF Transcript_8994/g.19412 Transcript_8994/m.19412 type:complete len:179 (-) Transcript_8994:92-628(-)